MDKPQQDIAGRLRDGRGLGVCDGNVQLAFSVMKEAADEIDRLRSILRDFAKGEASYIRARKAVNALGLDTEDDADR